jgi:hypothetical protein
MPQAQIIRQPGAPGQGWSRRFDRWFHRHSPKLAVLVAFGVACILGLAVSAGVQGVSGSVGPSAVAEIAR